MNHEPINLNIFWIWMKWSLNQQENRVMYAKNAGFDLVELFMSNGNTSFTIVCHDWRLYYYGLKTHFHYKFTSSINLLTYWRQGCVVSSKKTTLGGGMVERCTFRLKLFVRLWHYCIIIVSWWLVRLFSFPSTYLYALIVKLNHVHNFDCLLAIRELFIDAQTAYYKIMAFISARV